MYLKKKKKKTNLKWRKGKRGNLAKEIYVFLKEEKKKEKKKGRGVLVAVF